MHVEKNYSSNDQTLSLSTQGCSYTDDNMIVKVLIDYKSSELNRTIEHNLLEIPREIGNNILRIDGTYYSFANGLINLDGLYFEEIQNDLNITLKVSDTNLARIYINKRGELITKIYGKDVNSYKFLLALGVINNLDDLQLVAGTEFYVKESKILDEDLGMYAKKLYQKLYGFRDLSNSIDALRRQTFDNFLGSQGTYKTKSQVFSYRRFIDFKVLECEEAPECVNKIITRDIAHTLDMKQVTFVKIEYKGNVFDIKRNYESNFSREDLWSAIQTLAIFKKVSLSRPCDMNSIYNKRLYSYSDYIDNYVGYCMDLVKSKIFNKAILDDQTLSTIKAYCFKDFMRKQFPKVLDALSIPNSAEFAAKKYKFTKDLFKTEASLGTDDRLIHPTYMEWIAVTTSDSEKVGISGIFYNDTIKDAKLIRHYKQRNTVVSIDEQMDLKELQSAINNGDIKQYVENDIVYKDVELEPYELFNQYILYVNSDGSHYLYLNGEELPEDYIGNVNLICETKNIVDNISGVTMFRESDQAKRDLLGAKTVTQSLELIGPKLHNKKGFLNPLSGTTPGLTAGYIRDFVTKKFGLEKEYAGLPIKITEIKYINDEIIIVFECGSKTFEFKHPREIPAPSENNSLHFYINSHKDGVYEDNDILICTRGYDKVGVELNVIFANLEGYTYEDGITVTTDLVNSVSLSTESVYTTTIPMRDSIVLNKYRQITQDFDEYGLPYIGNYFREGEVIAKIQLPNTTIKPIRTNHNGYIKSLDYIRDDRGNLKSIKIRQSEILPLQLGDKMNNGHGNKGVIVHIINSEDICMADGTHIDVIINPLGTLGRMNFGQLKEMFANNICYANGVRATVDDIDVRNKTIAEIYSENDFHEQTMIFKGVEVGCKFFVGKINMYRSKYISSSQLNATGRSALNINGDIAQGQKMSELASLAVCAYGAQGTLDYLKSVQSKSASNYKKLLASKYGNYKGKINEMQDSSIYRINAFLNSVGIELTEEGSRFLTNKSIANLYRIEQKVNVLTDEGINGKCDAKNMDGYKLRNVIPLQHGIIFPNILSSIRNYIYCQTENLTSETKMYSPCELTDSVIQDICSKKAYFKNEGGFLYITDVQAGDGLQTGYFNLSKTISEISIHDQIDYLSESLVNRTASSNIGLVEKLERMKNLYAELQEDYPFKDYLLSGIPLAPINIRPFIVRDGKIKTVNTLNNFYRMIIQSVSDDEMLYDKLRLLVNDIKITLTTHSGATGNKYKGTVSHGEKTSELRDNTFARKYSNSGRSVATFDNNLEVYQLSIPFKILKKSLGDLIVKETIKLGIQQQTLYTESEIKQCLDSIDYHGGFFSERKQYAEIIKRALDNICSRIASISLREPTLRPQSVTAFEVVYNFGNTLQYSNANCESYNLDFDGDANPVFQILDEGQAKEAMSRMNPARGIVDFDGSNIWYSQRQDQLLGTYMLTKSSTKKSEHIYYQDFACGHERDFLPEGMQTLYCSLINHEIEPNDLVHYVLNKDLEYVMTVGKLLVFKAVFMDTFAQEDVDWFNSLNVFPLTSKTAKPFMFELYKKFYDEVNYKPILKIIKRLNNLAYDFYTYKGVTISPSELTNIFGEIPADEITSEFTEKEAPLENYYKDLCSITNPVFVQKRIKDISDDKVLNAIITAITEKSEFFSNVLASGARGKTADLVQIFGKLGEIKYGKNTIFNIDGNYDRGLDFVEKIKVAMPVRAANIKVKKSLGRDGQELRNMVLMNSNTKFTHDTCKSEGRDVPLLYDIFFKDTGEPISSKILKLSEKDDMSIIMFISQSGISPEDVPVSGQFIENTINVMRYFDNPVSSINGRAIEFKLKDFSKKLLESKTIEYMGVESLNEKKYLDLIEIEKPAKVHMYLAYDCCHKETLCERCYGKIYSEPFGIGMKVAFTTKSNNIQDTLDGAKSSTGTKQQTKFKINQLFRPASYKGIKMPSVEDSLVIKNPHLLVGIGNRGNVKPLNLDLLFCIKDKLILFDINDVTYINNLANEDCFIFAYLGLMSKVYKKLNPCNFEILYSNNVRQVIDSNCIRPFSWETKNCQRHWLNDNQALNQLDIVTRLCGDNASNALLHNCLYKRNYAKESIFGGFTDAFTKPKHGSHKTTITKAITKKEVHKESPQVAVTTKTPVTNVTSKISEFTNEFGN